MHPILTVNEFFVLQLPFLSFFLNINNSILLSNTKLRILRIEKCTIDLRTQLQHLFCRVGPSLHSLFFLQVLRLHCILPFWKNPDVITLYSFRVK